MITKKQLALAVAPILAAVVVTLKQCEDTTPVVPTAPVVADAGAP